MLRNGGADLCEVLGSNQPAQDTDYEAEFTLRANPMPERFFIYRGELDFEVELVGADNEIFFERSEFFARGNFDQNSERQGFMDDCLTNIQYASVIRGQDGGEGTGEP